ncbi:MAG TPA: type 4a pilus biogenesis protein PilO [Terriglobia bacterium]|nr:type 4a pilus biogenesis protein PilO [Terriglobia bacterium]
MPSAEWHLAASSSRIGPSRRWVRLRTVLAILAAVNVALLALLLRAPGRSEAQRREELARLQTQLQEAQSRVQRLRLIQQKVRDATRNEQEFAAANFLPRSSAFSQMLADLERLAAESRLSPGDVAYRLNEEANQLGWVNVNVSLTVGGSYSDLVRFLNRLEQSKLFWIVEGMAVSGKQGQGLQLNLEATTYLLPS